MEPESVGLIGPQFPPLFTAIEAENAVSVIFTLAFLLWALFTMISAYHWIRYGHRSSVAIPALITHIVVSCGIAIYAVIGFTP